MNLVPLLDPVALAEQRRLAGFGDALDDYNASPVSSVVGLTLNAGFGWLSWYLWKHQHPVWAVILGAGAVGGAGYNLYRLTSQRTP